MADDNNDSKLKEELLFKAFDLCDKIDEEYRRIVKKTDAPLAEILKECKKLIEYIQEEQYNLMLLSNQIKSRINYGEIVKAIIPHKNKVVKLLTQLKKITSKNNCHQCKQQLSNKLQVYFPSEEKIKQWTINKTVEGNWNAPVFFFCSKECFKQSPDYSHYQRKNSEKNKSKTAQQTENTQQNSEEIYICANCFTEKSGEYRYHLTKNDQKKFCSKECFNNFYGELCFKCRNKFLTVYHWNKEKYPNVVYCLECYNQEKQEQKDWEEKHTNYCRYCNDKLKEGEIFDFCDKEECAKKVSDEWAKDNGIEVEDDAKTNQTHHENRERERERERAKYQPNKLNTHTHTTH